MVLVAALLGSAICGIVTFCIALVIYKRNNAVKTDYSRETIFEATKRRLDVVTAASSSSLNDEHEQPTCSILERFQQMENSRNNSHSSSSGGAPLTRTETRYSADGASSTHSTRISFHTIPVSPVLWTKSTLICLVLSLGFQRVVPSYCRFSENFPRCLLHEDLPMSTISFC